MSFILDALRKSENARQRHGGPAFAEVPVMRRREGRPWWIAAVAALLLVNLVVLIVVLTRDDDPAATSAQPAPAAAPPVAEAPGTEPAPEPVPAAPAPAAPPRTASVPATPRSLADEAAGAVDLNRDPDVPASGSTVAANVPDRAPIVQSTAPQVASAPPPAAVTAEEDLPTINELTGDRAANMPAMHIDIHVYSGRPQERFVFINMKKYVEGETLSEGPVLERITADGAILNQRGFRFILPRQ